MSAAESPLDGVGCPSVGTTNFFPSVDKVLSADSWLGALNSVSSSSASFVAAWGDGASAADDDEDDEDDEEALLKADWWASTEKKKIFFTGLVVFNYFRSSWSQISIEIFK